MARTEADLILFMLASDYDPAHYYNWTEKELPALGNGCKAIAEVIKMRLEDNSTKVKEMYVIEHKGEKTVDSTSKEYHRGIDETKLHYHIVVKFESKQATLKKIAKYIGVRAEIIEKPKSGGHSYDNMLSYLTHIKYEDKIQYAPEDVVTLAGTDYMVHYNKHKESWIKARAILAKNGGKSRYRFFREAMKKLEHGELTYNELALTREYCGLLTDSKYQKKLFTKSKLVMDLAEIHRQNMKKMIESEEITSWEQIEESEGFKLLQSYGYTQEVKNDLDVAIKKGLQNDFSNLKQAIMEHKINLPFEDIEACEEYKTVCKYYKKEVETEIRSQAEREYSELYYAIINQKITRIEAKASGKYEYAYLFFKEDIEEETIPYHEPARY